jgi:predicted transcriptional regulator
MSGAAVTNAITAQITVAYLSNPAHAIGADDVPRVVAAIQTTIDRLASGRDWRDAMPQEVKADIRALYSQLEAANRPAIDPRKSLFKTHLLCINCGKRYTTLRRHLHTEHKLTPGQYRARWALPGDYPMTAPNYSASRSSLAKESGLGKSGRRRRRK